MKQSEKQFARELVERLEGSSDAKAREVVRELVTFLASRRELHRVRGILEAIDGAWAERYGASTIKIDSAYPLNESLRKKIIALAPGAELRERVDEGLIGGARLQIDELVLDTTIGAQLKRLQIALCP